MPTFNVLVPEGLSSEQKTRVAAALSGTYKDLWGVPEDLTEVNFIEVKRGNSFLGGAPVDSDQISVEGVIRIGRSMEAKRSLVEHIVETVAQAAAIPKNHVWAHLVEVPATQMAEFGHVLPQPGGEAVWVASMPEAERKEIEAIGRRAS